MQNKANLLDTQMNISYIKTKNYEQPTWTMNQQNKPNQTQFMVSLSNQQSQFRRHRRRKTKRPFDFSKGRCSFQIEVVPLVVEIHAVGNGFIV